VSRPGRGGGRGAAKSLTARGLGKYPEDRQGTENSTAKQRGCSADTARSEHPAGEAATVCAKGPGGFDVDRSVGAHATGIANSRRIAMIKATSASAALILSMYGACMQRVDVTPKQTGGAEASPKAPNLVAIAKASDLVFVGTVLDRGTPPSFWSGRVPAYQKVGYKVEEILKGPAGGGQIGVDHLVVGGSTTAEPGDKPALSSSMFAVGSRLLVFAVSADERWVGWNEVCGAVPYDADVVARVRQGLSN
jgi:hypothetical protein